MVQQAIQSPPELPLRQSLFLSISATLPSMSAACSSEMPPNAPQLQRHAHSFRFKGTNKVALDDMFLRLQELSLKDPAGIF